MVAGLRQPGDETIDRLGKFSDRGAGRVVLRSRY